MGPCSRTTTRIDEGRNQTAVKSRSAFVSNKLFPEWYREPCISLSQFDNFDTEILVKRDFFLDESDYGFECLIHSTLRDTKKEKWV